mgnify:CR=1 FL=1
MSGEDERNEPEVKQTGTCAICGDGYRHFVNKPEPLLPYEQRVCNDCNGMYVIPARMGAKQAITENAAASGGNAAK